MLKILKLLPGTDYGVCEEPTFPVFALRTPLHKFGVVFGDVELVPMVEGSKVGAGPGAVAEICRYSGTVFMKRSTKGRWRSKRPGRLPLPRPAIQGEAPRIPRAVFLLTSDGVSTKTAQPKSSVDRRRS